MLTTLKHKLARNLYNIRGWSTSQKIVVIESDDWGSIRMPSKEAHDRLLRLNIPVDKNPYSKFDSLASEIDLQNLFECLSAFRGGDGEPPVITANAIMCNPDFEKIRESSFEKYFNEMFTDTLQKYPKHVNSFQLWKEGIEAKIFIPQFHGREHINIYRWLALLKNDEKGFVNKLFNESMCDLSSILNNRERGRIQSALDYDNQEHKVDIQNYIKEGVEVFRKTLGFSPLSFISPNYIWDKEVESNLHKEGIKVIQGVPIQLLPLNSQSQRPKVHHFMGKRNSLNQVYLTRNCWFEPTLYPLIDNVDRCLKEIEIAFKWKKPAIICSHRVNYIGNIFQKNRDQNLVKLKVLLRNIVKKWPDVVFMSSDQLGAIILNRSLEK